MKQHSHLPVNIQLYNGKYPGSKCKLTSYKPSTYGISELLSDQPDYLSALENWSNLVEEESGPMETAEDISVPGEGFQKMPFWTTLSAGSSHHLRFYELVLPSAFLTSLHLCTLQHLISIFEASGVKPTSADMRMIVNMGGSAFHSTTSSIMRNPVSMLVHGNELSGKPPAGKGDGTGDGSGKSKRHRLRDPSDCVQRQTRIQIEVSDHQRAAQMSITDTSQSDVQGAESGKEGSKGQVQKSQKLFTQGYGGAIQTTLDPLLEHLMSDDVSNKEELKDLLGVQSNKPRRHIAQPHESSLGKGLSAELHSWIRFCMGG